MNLTNTLEEQALLEAIYNNPQDDTARLVYADWIEERDFEERAEYIRLSIQCQFPPKEATFTALAEYKKNKERALELLTNNYKDWVSNICPLCYGEKVYQDTSVKNTLNKYQETRCSACNGSGSLFVEVIGRRNLNWTVKRHIKFHRGFVDSVSCTFHEIIKQIGGDGALLINEIQPWACQIVKTTPITRFHLYNFYLLPLVRNSLFVLSEVNRPNQRIERGEVPTYIFDELVKIRPETVDTHEHNNMRYISYPKIYHANDDLSKAIGNYVRGCIYGKA